MKENGLESFYTGGAFGEINGPIGGLPKKSRSALDKQVAGNHYKEMAIQPIEFCQKNRLGYAESLAIKYLCRHQQKNGRQDLEKAIHCIELLLDLEYPIAAASQE